ncbi:aminoglycoside phosphotransferase family protein [Luteolibacter ambystomatis]|uniref:Aminoglycoside phosphotransferase family protein n=1 Tax=Luteolibacter ambystomatis TaxID=2824561 RepID=A0A975G9T9_9BACT|nr:aminoglycoside phosphotransferase family protein [Luteolibacter ambystomatis]QUE51532.1 aminoglycoside phosphotransferase family protein [Luteolibacter ambystomatis]
MSAPSAAHDLRAVTALFDMRADFVHAYPYGSGHINDTYCAWFDQAGQRIRYIVQRINHNVFKQPELLMENVDRVTKHALDRLLDEGNPEARRRTLTCVPSHGGKSYAKDLQGNVWRVYPFIERARGYDELETNEQAYQAARSFGEFQKLTADLGGDRLHETIPNFHNTPKRLEALKAAIEADTAGRAAEVQAEINFALARAADCAKITDLIAAGEIPERVTHNDTKLNNVLLDDVTAEGVCVIDLDTTMPGSALYDFGDMVRTATPTTREDDTDLDKLDIRLDRFEALVKGYLSTARSFLNPAETAHLAFAGKLLTLECGIRFLTDYLQGDVYFKIKRPGHNIDRCRNQFAFVAAIEKKLPEMEAIVKSYAG